MHNTVNLLSATGTLHIKMVKMVYFIIYIYDIKIYSMDIVYMQ